MSVASTSRIHLLLLLLFVLPAARAQLLQEGSAHLRELPQAMPVGTPSPLPELEGLEAYGANQVLALHGSAAQLLLLTPILRDSIVTSFTWEVVSGPGSGPAALIQPGEVDARLGLQVLLLDQGRRSVSRFNRDLRFQSRELLPESLVDLRRPDLLAISAGGTLVAADSRAGGLVLKRPGESWESLLDFAQAGLLRPSAMEITGERVYLLDRELPSPRLLLCGTEGGWLESWAAAGLCALHRGERGLLLLFLKPDHLELVHWPESATLPHLPAQDSRSVARYSLPPELVKHPPRDFLPLTPFRSGEVEPRLLLSRSGAPALILDPLAGDP